MLRSLNELLGYVLVARDGEIGRCKDFLFDEEKWIARYMVADTGKWLPKRKVLLSPVSLGRADWVSKRFMVELKKEEIEKSPPLDADAPVSRLYEKKFFNHYRWPYYWAGDRLWGFGHYPTDLARVSDEIREEPDIHPEESHLRSLKEITGYVIRAKDGEIGHVDDFIADDELWILRYLVVDTGGWLSGRKVLVARQWIEDVEWKGRSIVVDLDRDTVEHSPEFDPSAPVNRDYEVKYYDYYGRPQYWE